MSNAQTDRKFLITLGILIVLGLVMLTSASGPIAYQKFGDAYWYVKHQLAFGLLPGVILFFVTYNLDYRAWKRVARPFFIASLILLLLVFIPGIGAEWGTSRSWIDIGGFSLQPAEIVKFTMILFLAAWLERRGTEELHDFYGGLMPFLVVVGIVSVPVILQPDLGSLSIILATSFMLFFLAGAPWFHLAGMSAAGVMAFWLLVKSAPYRAARLMTFLHPELDPKGVGYHINQAFMAIGSGGLLGLGLGHSRQKFMYLPEVVGDSIFAVMAEEFGFVLTAVVLVLMAYFILRLVHIAHGCTDGFGRLFVAGVAGWMFAQMLTNIGSMIGLFPMTGVPLPFVSYGGTALMVLLASMGVVANVSRQHVPAMKRISRKV